MICDKIRFREPLGHLNLPMEECGKLSEMNEWVLEFDPSLKKYLKMLTYLISFDVNQFDLCYDPTKVCQMKFSLTNFSFH